MEDNFIGRIFTKIKDKIDNKKDNYPQFSEYSFNTSELDSLSKQNLEEINKLRNDFKVKKEAKSDNVSNSLDVISNDNNNDDNDNDNDNLIKEDNISIKSEEKKYNGYVELSSDRRENIMKRWNSIDIVKLNHDIYEGKDILDHNYTTSYVDKSLEYIYKIREEYDVLIEYLIGFNNEKKGILSKSIFSDKLDNEWKYLKNYIKVLEKIKNAIDK